MLGSQHARCVCTAASRGDGTLHVSQRVLATDAPVIVKTKQLMARAPADKQVLSLAQGIVHWPPPPAAMQRAAQLLASGEGIHGYGADEGLPALREALREKVAARNGLAGYDVMVTAGANQAFANLVLALCDASDRVVLFRPYYFNHMMALQMSGGAAQVVLGPCDPDSLHPDLSWLQQQLAGPQPPKMVVLVNPCNPTGVLLPRSELKAAAAMCAAAGTWLVLDNTYEDFVFQEAEEGGSSSSGGGSGNGAPDQPPALARQHHCIAGPHVLSVFSFSKAFGMMGWRCGYIAFPGPQLQQQQQQQHAGSSNGSGAGAGSSLDLGAQLLKVQDTVIVCASQLSQHIALAALQHGGDYLREQLAGLAPNRAAIADALSPLGSRGHGWVGGEGAIYYWARLPRLGGAAAAAAKAAGGSDAAAAAALAAGDEAVVEWLVREWGVCIIPGSACGAPGYVRVAFANLRPEQCAVAAGRLKAGLQQLARVAAGAGAAAAASVTQ